MSTALREWLRENERSQEWLARKVGRSLFTISRVINGKVSAGPELKKRIMEVTEIMLEDEDLSLNSNGKEKE